ARGSRKARAIVLGNMDSAAMRPIRQGDPDGVNYHTPYPIAIGVWDYFAHDVVRAIHIGVEVPPIRRAIEPALDPPPTKDRGRMGWSVDRERVPVEEARLTGVALLRHQNTDAHQLCLVLEHLDKAGMWHKHEVLIRSLPQLNLLFPAVALANHQ